MGELGRQLAGAHRARLVKDLIRACAEEWCADDNVHFSANILSGHYSSSTTELLAPKRPQTLTRANLLAQRILQLGAPVAHTQPDVSEVTCQRRDQGCQSLRRTNG
jgi:ferritin-like protein